MTKQKKEQTQQNHQPTLSASEASASPPVITVDYDLYAHYLKEAGLSEEQKRALLQTLWNIACEFVALGFNVHPVQQVKNTCGKPMELPSRSTPEGENEMSSLNQFITKNFAGLTAPEAGGTGESAQS